MVLDDTGLRVSVEAAQYLKKLLDQKTGLIGIRVGVKKAGCSGYEYILEYAYDKKDHDYQFQDNDVTVIVDKETYHKFLKGGTTIEYKVEGVQQGISFNNPNVESQCGCGESFNLKDDE
jgi:iron-sulfur cluster assembly protein